MGLLFKKILVANRGEIAIRIFRSATELGIQTVAIYTHEDKFSLHRYKADEAYLIGTPGAPIASYLDQEQIIALALKTGAEAIHPGYGFLSENSEFAAKCAKAGIVFIGPNPEILHQLGDKIQAKTLARAAGIPTIPGPVTPIADAHQALKDAEQIGFPVTIKARAGGGGRGIRRIDNPADFIAEFQSAQSEALKSFGIGEVYLEKTIVNPKHIEVQIMGDHDGSIVHLFERDCSIQRRNQKIVEVAPALGISAKTRELLWQNALTIAKAVSYEGLGTVEFLVDEQEQAYFLEVNPRLQVEHTVTEMLTGVDLVQASILIACGKPLSHPAIAIKSQGDVKAKGYAIQCRVTTEDPANNFAPSTGKITAFRAATGFGIRLDEGLGTTGGVVTPYYDSLLVKVTAWGFDLHAAARKMARSLSEFRIRGVKHNIPLLKNIVTHPKFLSAQLTTSFLVDHHEVFNFPLNKDRATKYLRYLSEVSVNNIHNISESVSINVRDPELPLHKYFLSSDNTSSQTAKQVFAKGGATALVSWIKNQKQLLLTDTTMRDAHQSLFATRLRSKDIFQIAPFYEQYAKNFFSLEMWGGATFDTSFRFLKEDPWERLARIRALIPSAMLQMLFRGNNAVGYANYPRWVIQDFIRLAVSAGLDIFRIFDCFNNIGQMEIAFEETLKYGGIVEGCLCYTGNLSSPKENKYTLKYYVDLAKELEKRGSHILCIKDMAGLLLPEAAKQLIKALKESCSLPIHLHTHDTSGNGVAMLLAATEAGCEIVDGAVSSMAGLTSQPSLNAIIAALAETPRAPHLERANIDQLSLYWEGVRALYLPFDPGVRATSTLVYEHEIPGGQYSNLVDQARKVGLKSNEFYELTKRYEEVNHLFGNIVKVTPSSKVVGDLALLLQKNQLTAAELIEKKPSLDYPDSVMSFVKGHIGEPLGGIPEEVRALILGANPPPMSSPAIDKDDNFNIVKEELSRHMLREPSDQDVISFRLYPKVFLEYLEHKTLYGELTQLPTSAFFYGIKPEEELAIAMEPGKTLYVTLKGISDTDSSGTKTVFYDLNGFSREIRLKDKSSTVLQKIRAKADRGNDLHVGAPMPGKIIAIKGSIGQKVLTGDVLLITEAMKMEYIVKAKTAGVIKNIYISQGEEIEDGDLLMELSES